MRVSQNLSIPRLSLVPRVPFIQGENSPISAWERTAINYGRESPKSDGQVASKDKWTKAQTNEKVDATAAPKFVRSKVVTWKVNSKTIYSCFCFTCYFSCPFWLGGRNKTGKETHTMKQSSLSWFSKWAKTTLLPFLSSKQDSIINPESNGAVKQAQSKELHCKNAFLWLSPSFQCPHHKWKFFSQTPGSAR